MRQGDERPFSAKTVQDEQDTAAEDRRTPDGFARDAGPAQSGQIHRHITDHFVLADEPFRDAQSGRWNACQIADALGVSLEEFAHMVGESDRVIRETPDAANLQEGLATFANVLAMVGDYFEGDESRVKSWLNRPQPRLGNRTPLTILRMPGRSTAVEQWITGLWLGDGD